MSLSVAMTTTSSIDLATPPAGSNLDSLSYTLMSILEDKGDAFQGRLINGSISISTEGTTAVKLSTSGHHVTV